MNKVKPSKRQNVDLFCRFNKNAYSSRCKAMYTDFNLHVRSDLLTFVCTCKFSHASPDKG